MTTIDKGTCKLSRDGNVVTISVICESPLDARMMFDTIMRSLREDKRIELLFSGLSNELYQGRPLQ